MDKVAIVLLTLIAGVQTACLWRTIQQVMELEDKFDTLAQRTNQLEETVLKVGHLAADSIDLLKEGMWEPMGAATDGEPEATFWLRQGLSPATPDAGSSGNH